jgi:hypothetical protein
MSWTESFPFLSNGLIAEYDELATASERAELEDWLGVAKVHNRQPGKRHVVSMALFWKHVNADHPELATPNRHRLLHSRRLGLVQRFDPYESYVEPLLRHGPDLTAAHPGVCFRVYLAGDLDFLRPELVTAGVEVRVMKSSSVRCCPGGFWRFPALGDRGKLVTVSTATGSGLRPGKWPGPSPWRTQDWPCGGFPATTTARSAATCATGRCWASCISGSEAAVVDVNRIAYCIYGGEHEERMGTRFSSATQALLILTAIRRTSGRPEAEPPYRRGEALA